VWLARPGKRAPPKHRTVTMCRADGCGRLIPGKVLPPERAFYPEHAHLDPGPPAAPKSAVARGDPPARLRVCPGPDNPRPLDPPDE